MIILLDNGHGRNTLGKHSPDMRLREYKYCREIVCRISEVLKSKGYDVRILTPEESDVSITQRCFRANKICSQYGAKNCVLVSVHNDAASNDNKWHDARGFSARISLNASASSKRLASIFTNLAISMDLIGNRSVPKEKYWQQNLGICRMTNCPAVLTENLFQDNIEDVEFLLSEAGKQAIVNLHVEALELYIHGTK